MALLDEVLPAGKNGVSQKNRLCHHLRLLSSDGYDMVEGK